MPGVAKPDLAAGQPVQYGVVSGTRIGYVYVYSWQGNAGQQFFDAIRTLTQDIDTDGLIIDFRLNFGGNMFLSNAGLSLLFPQPQPTIGFARRANPADHFKMELSAPPAVYVIPSADPPKAYNKPIAVLTGPGALSAGDQVALRMTYLPNVRTFGKSTSTAFNAPTRVPLASEWFARVALHDAYRVNAPKDYLTHDEFVPDHPVWLTAKDVAAGEDTVVNAAIDWILDTAP